MGSKILSLHSLSKDFSGHHALSDFSCSISKGHIHGLLGPNGAGKSTLMNILAGIVPPSKGEVRWYSNHDSSIGFLPEHAPLYGGMRVGEYIEFCASLKKITLIDEIDRVLSLCKLEEVKGRLIENLSRGYRQRVNLAQSLLGKPTFLILDEPFIGLDPQSIQDVRSLILSLKGEVTILFSSHQLNEVESICDDLTIMHKGHLLKSGTVSEMVKSVETQNVVKVTLKCKNDLWEEKLKKQFDLISINSETKNEQVELTISYSMKQELRPEIISYLVSNGASILEVKKQVLHLEDVFESMMQNA